MIKKSLILTLTTCCLISGCVITDPLLNKNENIANKNVDINKKNIPNQNVSILDAKLNKTQMALSGEYETVGGKAVLADMSEKFEKEKPEIPVLTPTVIYSESPNLQKNGRGVEPDRGVEMVGLPSKLPNVNYNYTPPVVEKITANKSNSKQKNIKTKNVKIEKNKPTKQRFVIVKKGNTLVEIAEKNNVPLEKLMKINKIKKNTKIKPGQKILLN